MSSVISVPFAKGHQLLPQNSCHCPCFGSLISVPFAKGHQLLRLQRVAGHQHMVLFQSPSRRGINYFNSARPDA